MFEIKPKLIYVFSFQSPKCNAVNRMFTDGCVGNHKQKKQESAKREDRRILPALHPL